MTFRKRYAYREPFGASARNKKQPQGGFLLVTILQSGLCIFMIAAAFLLSGIMGMTEIKTAYSRLAEEETDVIAVFSSVKQATESKEALKFKKVIEVILHQILPDVYSGDAGATSSNAAKQHLGAGFERLFNIEKMYLPVSGAITSGYGPRENPVTGKADWHTGIDIAAAEGTPIAAAWSGKVSFIGEDKIYGNFITVDHGGFKTRYCHCSSICAKIGEQLTQGEIIALSGSSGMVTGPHLHFELFTDHGHTDPLTANANWNDLEVV